MRKTLWKSIPTALSRTIRGWLLLGIVVAFVQAESGSRVTGRMTDPSGCTAPGAEVVVRDEATLIERAVKTNSEGIYEIPALPVGVYCMQVRMPGFQLYTAESLKMDVARTLVKDVELKVGNISGEVIVESAAPTTIDGATTSVGHLIDGRTVQEMPLNGRYILDLAILSPGSVTAPQNGFSAMPSRGLGAQAINTDGNREETVNYMINGITLNDLVFSSILFQPSISALQEFKIDNSTFSAQYGQSSGAIVSLASRSGASRFHGELFEFLRNDALDARNFFAFTSSELPPFKRNQFGGNLGGPIVRGKTFFFFSSEGLRQSQQVNLNSLVLSDAERRFAANGVIARLIELIPQSNMIDSAGTPRFVGSVPAPVNTDQWGMDINHILSNRDRLHGYYGFNRSRTVEPTLRGNTIPNFGNIQRPQRQFFSLNETRILGQNRINELRLGLNRLSSTTRPNALLNPADFGIRGGIAQPIGLPQINISGGDLNFGGPSAFQSGRGDTTVVIGDTMSRLCRLHSLKIGGEYRQFLNNNFRLGAGAFNFPSVAAFLADAANSFSVTLGNQSSSIAQGALGLFAQTNYKWQPNLTLELGLRYEWNLTPEERYGRFIVFDPRSASLIRLRKGLDDVYHQNNKNFQPRLGFAWDPFKDGRTSVRGAYAILVDQPMTSVVTGTTGNPPLAMPLVLSGEIRLENAIDLAQAAGLAPVAVEQGFDNAYLQSWNLNVQREFLAGLAAMAGYFGSKGTHLILRRNINQPVGGVRPYPLVSQSSAILPNAAIGSTHGRSRWTITRSARKGLLYGIAMTCEATAAPPTSTPATASLPTGSMTCLSMATGSCGIGSSRW